MKIRHLTIYTSSVDRITNFYSNIISLPLLNQSKISVSFRIGNSTLQFIERPHSKPYHFALNIPTNLEAESHKWLKERVELIADNGEEIITFESWNARAIYFYDVDNNIVEFIARKNLRNDAQAPFNVNQLIEISEIGLVRNNILELVSRLKASVSIEAYRGESERFTALGSETGLFVCIDPALKKWFPTMDDAYPSAFKAIVENNGELFEVVFDEDNLTITSAKTIP